MQALIDANARHGNSLSWPECLAVSKLCEVAKLHLDSEYQNFILRDTSANTLQIYQNDGTPVRVKVRVAVNAEGDVGGGTWRSGGRGEELLVQASCLRRRRGGELETAIRLIDPQPLSEGKRADANFLLSCRFFKSLRSFGQRGIAIELNVFDRALFNALDLRFRQMHFHNCQLQTSGNSDADELLYLTVWTLSVPCCVHDLQNAILWSLFHGSKDVDLIKDLHISIESLRNGYSLLLSHLGGFLAERVRFKPLAELPDEHILQQLWTSLGVADDTRDFLVKHRAIFLNDVLCVHDAYSDSASLLEQLSSHLLRVWNFRQFTDSRWTTMGRALRPIAAGWLTGLAFLAQKIISDPLASNFYIGGFR